MKEIKIIFAIILLFFLVFGSASVTAIKRYSSSSKNNGVNYLREKHPNAANIAFVTDGHNTSYFVVIDSNYKVTSYVSYNDLGKPKMTLIEK